MRQPRKAVIPAAGIGTRLLPATKSQPKEMLPVGRKPAIQYVVEEIYEAGIKEILIVTSQQKRAIEDHFDPDTVLMNRLAQKQAIEPVEHVGSDLELFYTRQSNPTGLADAIGKAEYFVGNEPFIVGLGDSIIASQVPGSVLKRLIEAFTTNQASAAILFQTVDRQSVVKYGIAAPKGEVGPVFEIEDLIEKPKVEDAPSNLAITARYVFSPEIFDYIRQTPPGSGGEIQITDSIRLMLQAGHRVWGVQLDSGEKRYDIGNFRSYFEAFFSFSLADKEFGEAFRDHAEKMLRET
ncbi:MAG: UTP--glucose-1-phosphate uridylyltransferase [Candidatus Poribacteria bacterium]|nr:UTP--glucose-1-phosphate uridylyltransferase [Candidatus Poribacteria bacterium]